MIKNVAKELIINAIYSKEKQIRKAIDSYVKTNYKEDYKRYTPNQWNAYYTKNIYGPVNHFYLKDCFE